MAFLERKYDLKDKLKFASHKWFVGWLLSCTLRISTHWCSVNSFQTTFNRRASMSAKCLTLIWISHWEWKRKATAGERSRKLYDHGHQLVLIKRGSRQLIVSLLTSFNSISPPILEKDLVYLIPKLVWCATNNLVQSRDIWDLPRCIRFRPDQWACPATWMLQPHSREKSVAYPKLSESFWIGCDSRLSCIFPEEDTSPVWRNRKTEYGEQTHWINIKISKTAQQLYSVPDKVVLKLY